jgi:AcrR family transcriptional regulator
MSDTPEGPVDARIVRTRNDVLGAALAILVAEGWEAVTHHRLAAATGYSRTTIYKHWPTRHDLLRDAFTRLDQVHHEPTGDLRTDLIGEMTALRTAIEEHHIDRVLAALVDLTTSAPEMADLRDAMVTEGEHTVRGLLAPAARGNELEAIVLMLGGAVLYAAMMYGQPPGDDLIASTVDLALSGLAASG